MQIVVSDSGSLSCLKNVSLIDTFLKLPHEFLIPNTLFEEEFLSFTPAQKSDLINQGLRVIELSGEKVLRVQELLGQFPRFSVHDGFALALAECFPGCMVLSGDGIFRDFAIQHGLEARGVLWVIDEIYRMRLASAPTLLAALRTFSDDPTVRLSRREISVYIESYDVIV